MGGGLGLGAVGEAGSRRSTRYCRHRRLLLLAHLLLMLLHERKLVLQLLQHL